MMAIRNLFKQREWGIVAAVLVLCILGTIKYPTVFWSSGNIFGILLNVANDAIIAIAMTILMVSGGFDMSVGSVMGFSGIMVAQFMMKLNLPVALAIILAIVFAGLVGLFNGIIVAKVKVNAFIMTLASLNMVRGLVYIVSNGENMGGFPKTFLAIGQSSLFGIQLPIIYSIVLVIIGDILLRKSRFLRQNFFIGGNMKAARLSGINVDRLRIFNFILCSVFAGIAGILWTSRVGSASVNTGTGTELRVITAVIIGGASLNGGEGSVIGSFFGALLMVMIVSIMSLFAVNVYWQNFVTGAVLLMAVLVDILTSNRRVQKNKKKEEIAA